jgi:hypothetical protein
MHDEPVDQHLPSKADELDERILHALEAAPELRIPADFASRVANRLPAKRPVSLTPTHYGYSLIVASIAILFSAVLVLAIRTSDRTTLGLTLQMLLFAQFIALTVWLSIRRHRVN